MEFNLNTHEGEYDLDCRVMAIGDDLLVAIWGGERPHVGAVAMAQPRPSLKDPEQVSSTASVFCFPGHKEDDLAKAAAEILSESLNVHVVVTAGIHWDNIEPAGIEKVIQNSKILVEMILEETSRLHAKASPT